MINRYGEELIAQQKFIIILCMFSCRDKINKKNDEINKHRDNTEKRDRLQKSKKNILANLWTNFNKNL